MRVDGYTITKLVHSSASAQIYEAYAESDKVPVFLKRPLPDGNGPVSRVPKEFRALSRISAPGIPRAIEVIPSDDGPVLVLERMAGAPLARVIETTPLAIRAWLDLIP